MTSVEGDLGLGHPADARRISPSQLMMRGPKNTYFFNSHDDRFQGRQPRQSRNFFREGGCVSSTFDPHRTDPVWPWHDMTHFHATRAFV